MKALLIEVDFSTGIRAGGIDARKEGKRFPCHPSWQNLDRGLEVRMLTDEQDAARFEGMPGVTILEGEESINSVLDLIRPEDVYTLKDPELFRATVKKSDLEEFSPDTPLEKVYERLYKKGVLGVVRKDRHPISAAQMKQRHGGKDAHSIQRH